MLSTLVMPTVIVDVLTPLGSPASVDFVLNQPGLPPRAGISGEALEAVPGPAEVVFTHPPGRFRLVLPDPSASASPPESPDGTQVDASPSSPDAASPTRLVLTLAELLVWLSDPGGRDLGGLSVVAASSQGEVWGRVGLPLLLWPGPWALRLGAPAAGIPWRKLMVDVRPSRTTLELGRLASLTVRWGKARGWPVLAHPLELARPAFGSASADAPVQATLGRSGDPFTLWPGQWLISLEDGSDAELELKGGHHTEVDLLALEHALKEEEAPKPVSTPLAGLRRAARTALTQRVSQTLAQSLGTHMVEGSVPESVRKLLLRAGPDWARQLEKAPEALLDTLWSHRKPHPADQRLSDPAPPVSLPGRTPLRLLLKDARGYELGGWPFLLTPTGRTAGGLEPASAEPLRGRIGLWLEAPPGRYTLQLEGLLPQHQEVDVPGVSAQPVTLTLPALGALELILRDGQGLSLRSASYRLSSGGAQGLGAFGRALPLEPGRYQLEVPTRPGMTLEVQVESGQVRTLDLGALSELALDLALEPANALRWGASVTLERLDGAPGVASCSSVLRGTTVLARVGIPLHVLPGTYRLEDGQTLTLRAGRARKPSTLGRSLEALAPDDANRER